MSKTRRCDEDSAPCTAKRRMAAPSNNAMFILKWVLREEIGEKPRLAKHDPSVAACTGSRDMRRDA